MKAMCIDENKNFVWRDVDDPVCHGVFDVKLKVEAAGVPEVAEAQAILERGENRGKVVLSLIR